MTIKSKSLIITLAIAIICFFTSCTSVPPYDVNSMEPLQKIIEVPGVSADELFVKANTWAVSVFNNADSVIEFSDKESGTVSGKYVNYLTADHFLGGWKVKTTTIININTKDGKARIVLTLAGVEVINGEGTNFGANYGSYYFGDFAQSQLSTEWNNLISNFSKNIIIGFEEEW